MATLATQVVAEAGTTLSTSAATATTGDKFAAGDGCWLHVNNGSGGSINVTITTPGTSHGLAVADRVVAVAAGAIKLIAIPSYYGDPADSNLATAVCSSVTTVTVAALRI